MRQRILDTADRLFYRRGIRAVGVDTIAAEAGVSKRTLYNHFASKDALIEAYLAGRATPLPSSGLPPGDQVLAVFDRLEGTLAHRDFRGCPFVNAIAELGTPRHPARRIAVAFKEGRRVWFRDLLRRLGASDPDGLATQLRLLIEGVIATALVSGDPKIARTAKAAALALLAQAGVALPAGVGKEKRRL